MMRTGLLRMGSAVVAAGLILAGCSGGTDAQSGGGPGQPVRIGLLLSLTGAAATFGIPERDAVQYKVDAINAKGGVDGRMIKLFVQDDQTDPTAAARGARSLMVDDQVQAVIGATTGSGSLAVGPIAKSNQVPVVAPNGTISVTAPDSGFYNWVFRSSINDLVGIDAVFANAIKDGKRVAVFYQEDAYGVNGRDRIEKLAKENGTVQVVETASGPLTAKEVVAQATKLRNANPDVILMQTSSASLGAAFMRARQQLDMKQPVWGPGGITTQSLIDAAGGAAEGLNAAGAIGWDSPNASQEAFIKGYAAAGKGFPQGFGEAIGVTALDAIVAAVPKVKGDLTGASLRDALEQACPFPTLFKKDGCYSAKDHDGIPADAGAVLVVKGSKWVTKP